MKLQIAIAFFFIYCGNCFSQTKKPEFEFTLYGEDSRGHKDSVIIGYAHDAIDYYLDTVYGDKNIANTKFDSVFEMRVHKAPYIVTGTSDPKFNKYNLYGVSKHITLRYSNGPSTATSCLPYGASRYGFILMKVKYPPLKLHWDKKLFERAFSNRCVGLSYLIHNEYLLQDLPPEARSETVWLGKDSTLSDSLLVRPMYPDTVKPGINYTGTNIFITYATGKSDTLQTNYLFGFESSTLAPTENLVQAISKIYPNPCRDNLNLFLPEVTKGSITVNIYGINGAIMQVYHKFSNDIISVETASLSSGNYIVEVITNDKRRFIAKFYKAE